MALGHSSESTMAGGFAFGKEAKAHGTDAVAIGTGAQANNNPYGIAIGKNAIVNNQGPIAIGQDSSSDHPYGIALGAITWEKRVPTPMGRILLHWEPILLSMEQKAVRLSDMERR